MNERDIIYQRGSYWVCVSDDRLHYTVYKDGAVCAAADSSYPRTADGQSLAVARVNYLSRREESASS